MRIPKLRRRFRIESTLAVVMLGLTILTALWPDWIELVFDVSPDDGSGWLEWALLAGLAVVCALMGLLARREWHLAIMALRLVDTRQVRFTSSRP